MNKSLKRSEQSSQHDITRIQTLMVVTSIFDKLSTRKRRSRDSHPHFCLIKSFIYLSNQKFHLKASNRPSHYSMIRKSEYSTEYFKFYGVGPR